jgi:hypothetical protein
MEHVNASYTVSAGVPTETISSVNGDVHIETRAAAKRVVTITGEVTIDSEGTAYSVETVSGAIHIGSRVKIRDYVKSVAAPITVDPGAEIGGSVENTGGDIKIDGATVLGGIVGAAANITVDGQSRIKGGLQYHEISARLRGAGDFNRQPVVIVGPNASVEGELSFKRPVILYVSDKATIGAVSGTTPIVFRGASPAL